jgi:cobalt-zinc-cadmium efflux system outer membrane protein
MRIVALALMVGAVMPTAAHAQTSAQAQAGTAISLDRLAQDVIANNPERQFYQRQIETAGVERSAAGRWADPETVVEFGQRRADDRTTGMPLGDGLTYAVSVVQPIEFGGRIALRRAIAERQVDLARMGLQPGRSARSAPPRSRTPRRTRRCTNSTSCAVRRSPRGCGSSAPTCRSPISHRARRWQPTPPRTISS